MKGKTSRKILVALALLVMLVGFFGSCRRASKEEEITPRLPSPLNISLELIPGVETGASVVVLRVFSRTCQQRALSGETNERIEPIEVKISRKLWTDKIVFQLVSDEGELSSLARDNISLLLAPESERLEFTERKVYQVYYLVSPSSCLPPRSRLVARLDINQYHLVSNAITIPPRPTSKFEAALRQARVNLFLSPEQLLQSAEELIREAPDSYFGYWYRGLALERRQQYQQALASFRTALQLYPGSSRNDHREPPALIIKKIRQLSLAASKEGTSN